MNKEHVISEDVLRQGQLAFSNHEHWIAYNTIPYFLESGDVHFFKTSDEAHEFSDNNISEYDNYRVINVMSVDEFLKQIPYGEELEQLLNNQQNLSIMNEKNLEYLKDNLKYQGFGDTLNPELENQLKKGAEEFSLAFKTEVNKREMEATLHFRKSDSTDMYFFNRYDSRLKNEKDETIAQTFYMNNGSGITLKEAYNLLNGRAVHKELTNKEGDKYQAWVQLDFSAKDKNGNYERKQFHENYGYDIKEALSYFPIKEMLKEDDMKSLLRSLEKGNVQMVTLQIPEKDVKVFIEANPQYKTINLYDNRMKNLDKDQRKELMVTPKMKEDKDQRQDQKQSLDGEGKDGKKQGRGKKAGEGEDNGLVRKKREGSKKSLGV